MLQHAGCQILKKFFSLFISQLFSKRIRLIEARIRFDFEFDVKKVYLGACYGLRDYNISIKEASLVHYVLITVAYRSTIILLYTRGTTQCESGCLALYFFSLPAWFKFNTSFDESSEAEIYCLA